MKAERQLGKEPGKGVPARVPFGGVREQSVAKKVCLAGGGEAEETREQ